MTDTTGYCRWCHRPLKDSSGQRGRPPTFCPPREDETVSRCARLSKRIDEISRLIEAIVLDLGEENDEALRSLQWLKSRMWSELNGLTNIGRLRSTGQPAYTKKRSGWKRNAPARD